MAEMTAQEQLMLELVNRARMDPNGEAKRLGIKLNEGVPKADKISGDAKQVLAGNDDLIDAAFNHSKWMNDNDKFTHDEGNKDPGDRMEDAGYVFSGSWTWGENIAARFESQAISTEAAKARLIEQSYEDLFIDKNYPGRGHRTNILEADFQEVGIGQDIGQYKSGSTTWNSSMVTQDFATSGSKIFITGVIYNDNDNDDFFSVGEQSAGVAINGGAATDTTGTGGGYELLYTGGGTKSVTFGGSVTVSVVLGSENIKIDLVNGDEIWTNATLTTVSNNVAEIHALGIESLNLTGSNLSQLIFGNKAANTIDGQGGNDTIDGGGGQDLLAGGTDADTFVFAKGDTGKTNAKADTIGDFTQGDDMIDLSAWDANSKKGGNQAFDFIDGEKFHKDAGELRFVSDGSDTYIQGDTNGDGKADFIIKLNGVTTLTATDFDL